MNRKFSFSEGEFYHVYNRGTDKRKIFFDDADYRYFLTLLFLCNSTERITMRDIPPGIDIFKRQRPDTLVDIGSHCPMPNHFHLFLYEKMEGGISRFLQKLCTAYVMYFNKKYKRTGGLFEGVFKATHVAEDAYFQYLFAYFHLNPIKLIEPRWKDTGIKDLKRAEDFLRQYEYSSYLDYVGDGLRKYAAILNKQSFPFEGESRADFSEFVRDWLIYKDEYTLVSATDVQGEHKTEKIREVSS